MWTEYPAAGVARVVAPTPEEGAPLLADDVLALLGNLTRRFRRRRQDLLQMRAERQARFDKGQRPRPRAATRWVRVGEWTCRTGPDVMSAMSETGMADFEDGLSPTFPNVLSAHARAARALREQDGVSLMRPRGLHLEEAHVEVDDQAVPASLYDIGVALHAATALVERGGTPCLVLPKLETFEEAFWYRDVLLETERLLDLERGVARVGVTFEALPAAFELDEILFALRDRVVVAWAGPRDFAASVMRVSRARSVVDDVPFASLERDLRGVCARRGVTFLDATPAPETVRESTVASFRNDVHTGVRYLVHWLTGEGTVSVGNEALIASDFELLRTRLWHLLRHQCPLEEGRPASPGLLADVLTEVNDDLNLPRADEASRLLRELVTAPEPSPSFASQAYPHLVEKVA